MNIMRSLATATIAILLMTCRVYGNVMADSVSTPSRAENAWSFYLSGYAYFIPEDRDFILSIFTADRGALHLEARYNYENFQTGSLFLGYNFSAGKKLQFEATPMFGVLIGATSGIAPGVRVVLGYEQFELSTDAEYVFDRENSADNFFYDWSELSYAPSDWVRLGIVTQRTRILETELELQRGLLAGISYKGFDVTSYVLNLGWVSPTIIFALGYGF